MADGFGDLGLRPGLVQIVESLGYEAPTPLQRAAVPVLRRGGNVVLHASAGAGVVGAYGLALVDRLAGGEAAEPGEEAGALRALVLVPTPEVAIRTATSLARFAAGAGLDVAALGPGWGTPASAAAIVVGTPAAALDAVRASALKLGGVATLVLDGLSTLFALDAQEAVEALTDSTPREAQRVVVTAEHTPAVADYVERHVRRALHIPPIPTEVEATARPEKRPLRYATADDAGKTGVLAAYLARREAAGPVAIYCRTGARAMAVAEALALRGFRASRGTAEDAGSITLAPDEAAPEGAFVISYDVPFDADALELRHADGGLVLVEPRELPHLKQIAERAAFEPRAHRLPLEAPAAAGLVAYRTRLERALAEEDLGAQLLVLEPLFERFTPAEVAAAASAVLRRRPPAAEAPAELAEAPARPRGVAPPPAPPAYVRLFFGVGARDGVRPGDLVGAITGEANVTGDRVGRIEIRDNLSIVEVDSTIADRVIRAVNGTTLKGRSVRVDYDRRAAGGERLRRRMREGGR
ncbi:MAG TPA: DbpA RNA binding domain-containing protein [Longimicrobiales bacterium]